MILFAYYVVARHLSASGKHHQEPLSDVVCIINRDLVIIY